MDFTPTSSDKPQNETTKEIVKDADRELKALLSHVEFAANHTKEFDLASAIEWTESYLARQGVTQPTKLSTLLHQFRNDDEVKAPYENQVLDLSAELGAWGNLLASDALNLVVASPKAGKSALMVHVFACSKRGDEACLGLPIRKRWNKLIINGNDMSAGQWGKILIREGLAKACGDDLQQFFPSEDVILWDTGNPARMNPKGIDAMRAQCLKHPGSLLIVDSLRSNAVGYDENKAEIREPIDLMKAGLAECDVTIVLIHHARKGIGSSSAIESSAGSNAIPAACDCTLQLKYLKAESASGFRSDDRLIASSTGRLSPDHALIELTREGLGEWVAHGDAEEAMRAEHIADVEERLTGRQLQVYEHAEEIAANGVHTTTTEIANQLQLTKIKAHKALDALCRKGLMRRCGTIPNGGNGRDLILFAPANSPLALERSVQGVKGVFGGINGDQEPLDNLNTKNTPYINLSTRVKAPVDCPLNTPVEISRKGEWIGGYLLANGSDPDNVIAVKTGNLDHRVHGFRWDYDIRPCQSAFTSTTDPLDF